MSSGGRAFEEVQIFYMEERPPWNCTMTVPSTMTEAEAEAAIQTFKAENAHTDWRVMLVHGKAAS